MNYFEWFELPLQFLLDEADLRRRFYAKSKLLHPDFYTQEDSARQAEILAQASFNNEAYETLADADKRMKYLLDLLGALEEEGQNQIPQDFLMDMMEVNEALMELEFDFDEKKFQQLQKGIARTEATLFQQVRPVLETFSGQDQPGLELKNIKDFYLKKRYLLRIKENLSKFAHR